MPHETTTPERLWKYRHWNEHTKRLIVNGEVYFATVKELNDPFEFRWREKLPENPAEIDLYVKELCAREFPKDTIDQRSVRYRILLAELHKLAKERKGKAAPTVARFAHGVFCLSEISDDILMWSHYAANHSGVCIGIRPDVISVKRFMPVTYSERVPLIDAWEYIKATPGMFTKLSLVKAAHWSYEKEWRTVDVAGPRVFPGCVDQVVIGTLADSTTRAEIRAAVASAKHDIKILEARLSDTHYRLDIRSEEQPKPTLRGPTKRKRRRARR